MGKVVWVNTSIRIPEDHFKVVRQAALAMGKSVSGLYMDAMNEYILSNSDKIIQGINNDLNLVSGYTGMQGGTIDA